MVQTVQGSRADFLVMALSFEGFDPEVAVKQYLRNEIAPVIRPLAGLRTLSAALSFDRERLPHRLYTVGVTVISDRWGVRLEEYGPDCYSAIDKLRTTLEYEVDSLQAAGSKLSGSLIETIPVGR